MKALLWLLGFIIGCTFILAKGYQSSKPLSGSFHPYNDTLMLVDSPAPGMKNNTHLPIPFPDDERARFKLIVLDN